MVHSSISFFQKQKFSKANHSASIILFPIENIIFWIVLVSIIYPGREQSHLGIIIVETKTKVYFPPANLKHIMTKHGLKNIGL